MKKQDIVELEIHTIGFGGIAVSRSLDRVVMLSDLLPGDKVKARITKVKKSYAEAIPIEIISRGESYVDAPCSHFKFCGGCSWQNMIYSQQATWKKTHVEDAFRRLGGFTDINVGDTISGEHIYAYRNKMEFSFGAARWLSQEEVDSVDEITDRDFALGFHIRGNFLKILNINKCHLQNDMANTILNLTYDLARKLEISAHNVKSHEGFLRNLTIRYSAFQNRYLVIITTNAVLLDKQSEFLKQFYSEIIALLPDVNLFHSINSTKSQVLVESSHLINGDGYLIEKILDIEFKVSPYSFFQTNYRQLDNFIDTIIKTASLRGNEIVWDLYCGTGSITLPMSRHCSQIWGAELSQSSIADASENMQRNKIDNAHFFACDLHSNQMPELLANFPKPDVIVVDPPRAGMHKNMIAHILQAEPETIVYVSCNPTTQARDCADLAEKYNIVSCDPFDMFPHTYHIESIVRLEKKA